MARTRSDDNRTKPVGAMTRRGWRRLERRAARAHEADLEGELARLAAARPEISAVSVVADPARLLRFVAGGATVVLAGIDPGLGRALGAAGPRRLVAAGRYGPRWWLAFDGRPALTVLGTRVGVRGHDGGIRLAAAGDVPGDAEPARFGG